MFFSSKPDDDVIYNDSNMQICFKWNIPRKRQSDDYISEWTPEQA